MGYYLDMICQEKEGQKRISLWERLYQFRFNSQKIGRLWWFWGNL